MPSNPDAISAVESPERKLAAILSADVAGYSALMGRDEAATVRTLSEHRAVVRECVERHSGKVDDAKGDAILAEFASPVNAVSCAVEIQRQLGERNAALPENLRMSLRIGVNLGDVIVKDDTVYGDGVNIAARLEALAEPGGICISRMVYDHVKGKLPLSCESIGKKAMKNIAEPVEVFRVHPAGISGRRSRSKTRRVALALAGVVVVFGVIFAIWQWWQSSLGPEEPERGAALTLPEGPSIAVLPFSNLSGKPDEDWLSDGMTETLITDLSRLNNLFVTARNSSFAYKDKPVEVQKVGRQLGVHYILEGSVQRTGDRLRVNAQLVEAATGRHVWAERYDRTVADVFDVQDDITQRIITELDVKLLAGEQARAWRRTTRNRQAYELYLRGREHHERFTREDIARAQTLLQEALDLDPKFAMAMVWLGWTHVVQADSGWTPDWRKSIRKAIALGQRATTTDPALGDAYAAISTWLPALERYTEAVEAADRAVKLGPNQADVLALSSWTLAQNGRAAEALPLMQRALRLNPFPPSWYFGALGDSLLFAGRIEEAMAAHRKCLEPAPELMWCQLALTVDYAVAGKTEEAAAQAKEILKINPKTTADENTWTISLGIPEERRRMIGALRASGLK